MFTKGKIGAAVSIALLTGGLVYQHASYVDSHSFHLNPGIHSEMTKTSEFLHNEKMDNLVYLANIDNRNADVAAMLVGGEIVVARTVAYGGMGLRASGTMQAGSGQMGPRSAEPGLMSIESATSSNYIDEQSTTTVIDGVENLGSKYGVYFYADGKRNSLTPELMYILETECAKYDLDPYVMIGVIMTESRGNARAKNSGSTATGLCQILAGTGKFIYEDWMGNGKGTYNHSMAYDPELNIRMGCTYLGRLKQQKGLYKAIQSYRGKTDISGYCASINKYMGMSGRHLPF